MAIPNFPQAAPISLDMQDELYPRLSLLPHGISEYTFAGLYLFRKTYNYHLSRLPDGHVWITGTKNGANFGMLPCGVPEDDSVLAGLLDGVDYIKGLSRLHAEEAQGRLHALGYTAVEDRDNFDYLYLRSELAELAGRKFHKKRNHVNAFVNSYNYREDPLTPDNTKDALWILQQWHEAHDEPNDYEAAREALELWEKLELIGYLVYVDEQPAAYTLGEPLQRGRSFVVHFEKAIDSYRGIYQFINKAFACILPRHYNTINREQDLGDEGLRQSKMTYRPVGFVEKYRVVRQAAEQTVSDARVEGDDNEQRTQSCA